MQVAGLISDAEFWIGQVFASKSAKRGAVVRRSVAWVHREIGDARFRDEVRQRGYHLLQTADQYIVICHNGPIQLIF